jgi:hypothetical protein
MRCTSNQMPIPDAAHHFPDSQGSLCDGYVSEDIFRTERLQCGLRELGGEIVKFGCRLALPLSRREMLILQR